MTTTQDVERLEQFVAAANFEDSNAMEQMLLLAVSENRMDMAKFLLEQGANPNASTPEGGITCLHMAAIMGADVKPLLDFGADRDAKNRTELHGPAKLILKGVQRNKPMLLTGPGPTSLHSGGVPDVH